jgi:hypothetical protein
MYKSSVPSHDLKRLNPRTHVRGNRRRKKAWRLMLALGVGLVFSLLFAVVLWLMNRSYAP